MQDEEDGGISDRPEDMAGEWWLECAGEGGGGMSDRPEDMAGEWWQGCAGEGDGHIGKSMYNPSQLVQYTVLY